LELQMSEVSTGQIHCKQ